MENTTVGQRFVQLISHLGMSKNAFATSLEKTATVIQHLVEERNKPGFDLLCKVFEVYPNVSKEWLLQGTGPMLTDGQVAATAGGSTKPAPAATTAAPVAPAPVLPTPVPQQAPQAEAVAPAEVSVLQAEVAPAATPQASAIAAAEALPAAPVPAVSEASWQTALYTQQMAHQLALAELRNQHLQEQQRLMQQMMDLMQRQLNR